MSENIADKLINQLETVNEKINKYSPFIKEYLQFDSGSSEEEVTKKLIISKALRECDINFLNSFRDYLNSKGLQSQGIEKIKYYNLSSGISNDFRECGYDFNNLPPENNGTLEKTNELFSGYNIKEVNAVIGGKKYILISQPIFENIGENNYKVTLNLRRDSNSSSRGVQTIVINYQKEGNFIKIFDDFNRNEEFDNFEKSQRIELKEDNYKEITKNSNGNIIIREIENIPKISINPDLIQGYRISQLEIEFIKN